MSPIISLQAAPATDIILVFFQLKTCGMSLGEGFIFLDKSVNKQTNTQFTLTIYSFITHSLLNSLIEVSQIVSSSYEMLHDEYISC